MDINLSKCYDTKSMQKKFALQTLRGAQSLLICERKSL